MSKSHDIEQIARHFAKADGARSWNVLSQSSREYYLIIAGQASPLISAAEAKGAKSMQERAKAAALNSRCGTSAYDQAGVNIATKISDLPLLAERKLCPACGEPERIDSDVTGLHPECPLVTGGGV